VINRVKQLLSTRNILLLILLFAAASRLWRLNLPANYYFDEVYHVVTVRLIAQNDPRAYEWWHSAPEPDTAIDWLHPPLAKLTQAASIIILGNNGGFGWRFSSAVFGIGVIALTYALARKLNFSPAVGLLAAGLASLDGLLLAMSRITMNDIHITFFFLLTMWLYLHWRAKPSAKRLILVGLAAGAAAASKWSGVFVVLPIMADQLIWWIKNRVQTKKVEWRRTLQIILALGILMPLVYLLSYSQMFWQGHDWQHFKELHQQIWWYQTNLTATHPYQSTPLEWLLNYRPVYTYTNNPGDGLMQNMYIQGNHILLWGGLAAVLWTASSFLVWLGSWLQTSLNMIETKSKHAQAKQRAELTELKNNFKVAGPLIFLLISYLSTWIVWTNSPRIMFFYHYTPALPFLFVLLSYWLIELYKVSKLGKYLSLSFVGLAVLTFVIFYPNWTGLPVNAELFSKIFFLLPSWR